MPAAPPAAETKKPATPPPDKAAGKDKAGGQDAAAGAKKGAGKTPAGPDKAGAGKAGSDKAGGEKAAGEKGSAAKPDAGKADAAKPGTTPAGAGQQRFDRMAVRAKLAVSEPGDAVEREADAVADKVMRMPEPQGGASGAATAAPSAAPAGRKTPPQVVRAASASPETAPGGKPVDAAKSEGKPPPVRSGHPRPATTEGTQGGAATQGCAKTPQVARAASPGAPAEAGKDQAGRLSVPADFAERLGAGEALDAQTRAFFEQRLEADLSGVRVHTDAAANKAALDIGAKAFTYGSHIAFASGQYQPGSAEGKRLLAHELAHVQQQTRGVARMLMRQPAGSAPAGGSSNDIELKGIKIPAFKKPYYTEAPYRRAANYKRSEKGSSQKKIWNDATKGARDEFPGKWGLKDGAVYAAIPKKTKLEVGNGDLLLGEPKAIGELMQRPKWRKDGTPNTHDIDHKVELQIGGPGMDKLENLELRDSKANQASGRDIDGDITAKLREVKDKENGDPDKIRANPNYQFVFSDFADGGGATDSSVWTLAQIKALEPGEGLTVYDPDATADTDKLKAWPKGVDKKDFFGAPDLLVLYPSRRGGKPQKIKLDKDGNPQGGGLPKDWIPGFTLESFDLKPGSADQLGSLTLKFAIPKFPDYPAQVVPIRKLSQSMTHAGFLSVEGVRNKIAAALNAKTPVPQASPVTVDDVDILPGTGLLITGQLHPSVAILGGPIDFEVSGKSLQLSKTFTAGEVKIPGPFKVKASSLTVAFNSATGFSVTGFVGYEIPKLGEGSLNGAGVMDGFKVSGTFTFDKKLFDGKAELKATYEKSGEEGKFSGTVQLEISEKKIKGIKKATIDATIDNEKFTLDGKAQTSIPGIKEFSVGIKFVDAENFSITGKGDFEKLPGIESGSLTMTLDRAGDAWELSGTGNATPKLPGGATGAIEASYKKGVVLVRGGIQFTYGGGLLDGKVTVAVTNAASVDKDGNPSGEGGDSFKIGGEGDLRASLIKDKLDGKLKLRLLEDGSIRVGGGLEVKPFEVFGKYPSDGGEFFNKEFSTPPIPLPGFGFAVGSVSVGVNFSASLTLKAHASVGPGKINGITLNVEEFDPANVDFKAMKFTGGGTFVVYADAGFSAAAAINLIFSAAIAQLVGSVGVEASAGIPKDKPVLSAHADFSYSQNDGLDISGVMNLSIAPELKFRLFGAVKAQLNVVVDTITVWSQDFTLAEANYKLPIGINATGNLGYNTKTGKVRPDDLSQAIKVETPQLTADQMKGVLLGENAPPKVENKTEAGRPPDAQVNPKRVSGAAASAGADEPPPPVDEDLVSRLGSSEPLDLATRGFFEQRLQADLGQVQIHTGPAAAAEARRLSARAFTVGSHIAFAEGEYRPDSPEGKALLAHELAHVVQQQGGAPTQAARLPTGPGSVTPGAGAAPAPAASTATETPAQRTARAQRELAQFVVPVSKRRHGAIYAQWLAAGKLKHGPNYDREADPPSQVSKWESRLAGFEARPVWSSHFTRLGLTPTASGNQPVTFSGGHVENKPFNEWVEFFKRPQWNHGGTWLAHRLEVDHIVELQAAGWPGGRDGDEPENYELLDKSTNASAGGTIYVGLRQKMRALVAAERGIPLEQVPSRPGSGGAAGVPDAETELKTRGVVFTAVQGGSVGDGRGGGRRGDANSEFWALSELQAGEHLAAIHSPPAGTGGSGTAQRFLLLSAATGGMEVARLDTSGGREVSISGPAATRLASMRLTSARFNDGYGTATPDSAIGSLQGQWRLPPGITPAGADPVFTIKKARDGQFNGYAEAPASLSMNATGLSPIEFTSVGLDGAGLNASGRLMPSVPLFANQPIEVSWTHEDIRFARTFTADALNLRVPGITLDAASVSVFYNRAGFGAEGAIHFTLAHLGTGSLTAGVDGAGRFSAEGRLDLDTRTFDEANLAVWYRDGAFGGSGHLAITQPGRIRGVNAASIDVTADAQAIRASGNVQPAIPGVQNAALTASYGAERGLVVAGDLQLANIAGIREGSVHAEVQKQDGQWHLSAAGRAVPALPGVNSEIVVSYADGLFDGSLSVDYARSIFSGNVTVGLTNRAVNPEGEVSGPAPADGTDGAAGGGAGAQAGALSIYGSGTVTARLTDWLQGGIGVRVRPSGDLRISGRIGIPQPVTVFDAYPPPDRATRTLFSMPTVSVPLVGLSVGSTVVGVALTINGRVTGHAQVGPGRLTQTELRIEDFDPAQPESLHVTGDAEFNVGAEAGVSAQLDAGVSLGAAVINATAGINVSASAALQASARPHVHLDWRAGTGLALHADLDASLSPRLAFDVNGFAEVTANAFVTTFSLWRKDWNLAHREIGSNLALRIHAPVDYFSDGRGVVFDPEQVRFDVPSLNADTLRQLLNDEGGREHVERAPAEGRTAAAAP